MKRGSTVNKFGIYYSQAHWHLKAQDLPDFKETCSPWFNVAFSNLCSVKGTCFPDKTINILWDTGKPESAAWGPLMEALKS